MDSKSSALRAHRADTWLYAYFDSLARSVDPWLMWRVIGVVVLFALGYCADCIYGLL